MSAVAHRNARIMSLLLPAVNWTGAFIRLTEMENQKTEKSLYDKGLWGYPTLADTGLAASDWSLIG